MWINNDDLRATKPILSSTEMNEREEETRNLELHYGRARKEIHTLKHTDFGPLDRSRQAEVAMAIRRPSGKILLQTKKVYPEGIFRIPTGGLKAKESIEAAVRRETLEETALEVEILKFVSVLRYEGLDRPRTFWSYLFLLEETGGTLLPEDPDEGITDWIEADPDDLRGAAARLRAATSPWHEWGGFRALAIDALLLAFPS